MRQVVITRHGGPEVLQVQEAPDPQPREGEVRIRVKAAGLNFADVMARVGMYRDAPPPPAVMGYEVAGEIDLPRERAGERVIGMPRFGGQSELVCVKAGKTMPIPAKLSFAEAASIPVVWLTAWHMLVEMGHLQRGYTVLIHAAAGGVGTAALQICKKFGAQTIGTASKGKHERLKQLGLDHAIDYRSEDFERRVHQLTNGRGVDIVLDATGAFKKSFRCLGQGGRLFMYGASNVMSGEKRNMLAALSTVLGMPWFHPLKLLPDNKGIFGVNMGKMWGEEALMKRELSALLQGFESGEFRAIVDAEVPFAEAARAHQRLSGRENFGKVVLVP